LERLAIGAGGIYSEVMKFRRSLVFALTVALAFMGSSGPRHAQAVVQKHHHTADAQQSGHSHGPAADHAHYDGAPAASKFAADGTHDHAGSAPQSDQGCCYAWCNSVAIVAAADWLFAPVAHDRPLALTRPFQIASISSAIDPPPR